MSNHSLVLLPPTSLGEEGELYGPDGSTYFMLILIFEDSGKHAPCTHYKLPVGYTNCCLTLIYSLKLVVE